MAGAETEAIQDAASPTQAPNHRHIVKKKNGNSEEGLPEESTMSGCKALLDGPPEEEADPKKHQQTNTGKGNKGKPTAKA